MCHAAMCLGMCLEKLNPCLPCFPCALLEKVKPSLIWISALLQLLQTPKDIHHSARKLVNNGPNLRWRRWWYDEYRATFKPMTSTTIQKTRSKFLRVHPEKQKGANFLMRETEQWESGLIKQSIKGSTCNAFHRSWPRRKSDPGLRKPFITWYYFYAKPPTEPLLKRREKCSPKKMLKEKIFKVTEILKPKQNVRSIKSEREN